MQNTRKFKYPGIFLLTGFAFLLLMAGACNSKKEKGGDADRLQKEVEAIHDETMAKIGALRYYQDTLGTLLRAMNTDSTGSYAEEAESFTMTLSVLNEADDAMMDWMRNYNPGNAEMSREERLKYLQSEKNKILEVQDKMDSAISRAESLLKKSN